MDAGSARRARWRLWLPRSFDSPVGLVLAAGYYALYAAPVVAGVRIDPLRFHWILSAVALATAVIWLCERGGAARVAALAVNVLSSFANLVLLASLYIQGAGFNAQFFHHFDWETLVVGSRAFAVLCVASGAWWLLVGLWPWLLPNAAGVGPGPRRRAIVLVVVAAVATNAATLSLGWHAATTLVAGNRIVLVPKRPQAVVPAGVARPRDLVVVVAESLEATFGRADVVGKDLTPGLTALAAEGLRFTDMRQVSHTGWTTGALVASWCAEPMPPIVITDSIIHREEARMQGRTCLGDVLAAEGYRGVFMVGHSLAFADVGGFYAAHGFTELLGLKALAPSLTDPDYRTGWGLYDDTLLGLARAKAAQLAADKAPFVLVVLTMDTHFSAGSPSPSRSCGRPGGEPQAAFTVRCADRLLAAFVRDIRSILPDAVIVLYSDHLTHFGIEDLLGGHVGGAQLEGRRVDAWRRIVGLAPVGDDPGVRRLRFAMWDPAREQARIDRPGTHFDVMPTVLDAMGFEAWQRHAFGASLLRTSSPWLEHPDPDTLQIVYGVPAVELRPGTEVFFHAGASDAAAPTIDVGGVRMLATGSGLGLGAAAFALSFGADGVADRILDTAAVEAVLASGGDGETVVGVSGHAGINGHLRGANGDGLVYFVVRGGSPDLVAGPLPPGERATVRVVDGAP